MKPRAAKLPLIAMATLVAIGCGSPGVPLPPSLEPGAASDRSACRAQGQPPQSSPFRAMAARVRLVSNGNGLPVVSRESGFVAYNHFRFKWDRSRKRRVLCCCKPGYDPSDWNDSSWQRERHCHVYSHRGRCLYIFSVYLSNRDSARRWDLHSFG